MKKFFLSFGLIFTFGIYAVYQQSTTPSIQPAISNTKSLNVPTAPSTAAPSVSIPTFSLPRIRFGDDEGENEGGRVTPPRSSQIKQPSTSPTSQQTAPVRQAPPPVVSGGMYKDGQYTGSVADAYYGNVQVQVTVQGGKITDVQFLDYPQDRGTSIRINSQAMPYLRDEAIQAQNANVDVISGATQTSRAFIESLTSALASAKN